MRIQMGQTILASRKTKVNAFAEGNLIDNLTVVNGEITVSKNLAYFTDMTRFIPFTKPQDIYFDMYEKQENNISKISSTAFVVSRFKGLNWQHWNNV